MAILIAMMMVNRLTHGIRRSLFWNEPRQSSNPDPTQVWDQNTPIPSHEILVGYIGVPNMGHHPQLGTVVEVPTNYPLVI